MAPPVERSESFYLAPLAQCLKKGHRLISWTDAFEAISSLKIAQSSRNLAVFFSEEACLTVLSRPFVPFDPPSQQSKSEVENRTAQINVTQSRDGYYDIEEIKGDTLWLSKQANVDEIQALRIVILEWQQRPSSKILQGYTEEESFSLQQALGNSGFDASFATSWQQSNGGSSTSAKFDSEESRHERLLRLLLSEKRHLLAVALILFVKTNLDSPLQKLEAREANGQATMIRWIVNAQSEIKKRNLSNDENLLIRGIEALKKRLENLESGSGCFDVVTDPGSFEQEFQTSQVVEIVRILQHVLAYTLKEREVSSASITSWFQLVDQYGFFELFQPPTVESLVPPIRAMVCLISLQILNLDEAVAYLESDQLPNYPPPSVLHSECSSQITDALFNAADHASRVASPAAFAWSVILENTRNIVESQSVESPTEEDMSPTWEKTQSQSLGRQATSNAPQYLKDLVNRAMSQPMEEDDDPIRRLASIATDACGALDVVANISEVLGNFADLGTTRAIECYTRITLLGFIRQTLLFTSYNAESLNATLAALNMDASPDDSETMTLQKSLNRLLVDQEIFVPDLLLQARSRYPYELEPFLSLGKALALLDPNAALPEFSLRHAQRFTQVLPRDFTGYELVGEDENANRIRLTVDLPLFAEHKAAQTLGSAHSDRLALVLASGDEDGVSYIPRGTIGYVLNESRPFVVMWEHSHQPLKYLGMLLSTVIRTSSRIEVCSESRFLESDVQADTINLLASELLSTVPKRPGSNVNAYATGRSVLEEMSEALGQDKDIVSVVSEIFEEELSQNLQPRREGSTVILTACVRFFQALCKVDRSRIWPLLSQSQMLEIDGKGGRLASVVAAIEVPSTHYDFLEESLHLFEALVDDVVSHAVAVDSTNNNAARRFDKVHLSTTGLPQKKMSAILSAFTRIYMDVLSISPGWNFSFATQRLNINARIIKLFDRLVRYVYGFDSDRKNPEKLTAVFAPAAKQILAAYLGTSTNTFAVNPLLNICMTHSTSTSIEPFTRYMGTLSGEIGVTLDFLRTLVELSVLLDTPSSYLEQQLFLALPSLARLYSFNITHKKSIVLLLTVMVKSAARSQKEPASLLGHLGPSTAKNFLKLLGDLGRPLNNHELETSIWKLFKVVVSERQQWFATLLLTGSAPKPLSAKDGQTSDSNGRDSSVLSFAIESVAGADTLYDLRMISSLDFISAAQKYWPWLTPTLHKHRSFIITCVDYIDHLVNAVSGSDVEQAQKNQAAAVISELLATYLHNMRQLGDTSPSEKIAGKLRFLRDNGVAVPTYNVSLHSNMKRNFENTFSGCSPSHFKKTIDRDTFGPDYFYDRSYATEVLSHHPAWHMSKDRGFANELGLANINLSLVESQIILMNNWKSLAIELSRHMAGEKGLQTLIGTVVQHCIVANSRTDSSEAVFESLGQHRLELVLVLLQRLVALKSDESTLKQLVSTAWDATRASGLDFDTALMGNSTEYCRTLLKVLLLSLQPHTYLDPSHANGQSTQGGNSMSPTQQRISPNVATTVVEISAEVIGKGFRCLATQLHEDASLVQPSDLNLLLSIFQSILRMRGLDAAALEAVDLRLRDAATARYAAALFSWSDNLALSETNEPIFADLAISFLREMSNMPNMAEFLATEGILSILATANIANRFRRTKAKGGAAGKSGQVPGDGVGPFTPPSPTLHTMWARGMLPLVLNILAAVGDAFGAEAASFLNSFPHQLSRAATALSGDNFTLGDAAEVHSLSLLALILDRGRNSPAYSDIAPLAEGWDGNIRTSVREDAEALLQVGRRTDLRGRIVPVNEKELNMSRSKAKSSEEGCENQLEEEVVRELRGVIECLSTANGGNLGSSGSRRGAS